MRPAARPLTCIPAVLLPLAAAVCLHCAASAPTPVPAAKTRPSPSVAGAPSATPSCLAQSNERQRAVELRAQGRLLRASAVLRASLQQCPLDSEATILLAETSIDLGRFDEAKSLLDSAVARSAPADAGGPWDAANRRLSEQAAAYAARPRDPARALELYRAAILADAAGDHPRARQGFYDAWMASSGRSDYLIDSGLSARAAADAAGSRRLIDRASAELEARFGPPGIAPDPSARFGTSYLSPTLSPDTRYVVTASGDEVALHDARTWHRRWRFVDYAYPHPVVARMSPDDLQVAVANANGTLQFIDASTGKLAGASKTGSSAMLDLAFRPDGAVVATSCEDASVRLWEVPSGKLLLELKGHTAPTRRVAFSPDGATIVSTSEDKTAKVWNANTGALLHTLEGHTGPVRGVSIRGDGRWVATSSDDKTVRLWELQTGRELRVMKGHTGTVWRVAFHPDGSRLASFSADDTIRVWDAATGNSIKTIASQKPGKGIAEDSHAPADQQADTQRLASVGNLPVLGGMGTAPAGGNRSVVVVDVMYRADGRLLAFDLDTTTADLAARYWDVDQDRSIHRFGPRKDITGAMAFDADASRLAVATYGGTVRVWDLAKGSSPVFLPVSQSQLRTVVWIPTRNRLAVGDDQGMVTLVDATGVGRNQQLGSDGSTVRTLTASGDGKLLVSVSEKGELRVWNTDDGKMIRSFKDRALASVGPAAISADGKRVVVGASYHGPAIVDLAAAKVSVTVPDNLPAALIGFTPDGASVAQLGEDGTFALWEANTGAVKTVERGSESAVHFCSWVKAMRGESQASTCVEPRRSPRFWSAGSLRLPNGFTAHPRQDLAAGTSLLAGIELWRPSREGELIKLLGPGDGKEALALTGNEVELFGEEARSMVLCTWGDYRAAFEVCEDRFTGKDVISRALKR